MIFTLLLLGALLPHETFTAYVNVGIVNGTEAKPHSRPYMVSVQRNKQHICGGFLVSEQFVMTAAHCFENFLTSSSSRKSLTVVVGAQDLKHSSDHMAVKFYHIYPGYDSNNLQNDIMILQIGQWKNQKTKNVQPISLSNNIKAKSKCSVAGWGRQTTNGSLTDRLMEVDVIVIDSKSCQKYWGKTGQYDKTITIKNGGGTRVQGGLGTQESKGGGTRVHGVFQTRGTLGMPDWILADTDWLSSLAAGPDWNSWLYRTGMARSAGWESPPRQDWVSTRCQWLGSTLRWLVSILWWLVSILWQLDSTLRWPGNGLGHQLDRRQDRVLTRQAWVPAGMPAGICGGNRTRGVSTLQGNPMTSTLEGTFFNYGS